MSIQTASEEKLSLMSSLAKTWGKVYNLPESHDDRWVGMQPEVEGGTTAVERIEDGVRRLDHREPGDTTKNASSDVQKAAIKLSGHLIAGTDIADSAMRQAGVDQHDAEVAQSWTEALQFVDAFCRESQRRIEGVKQDAHADTGGEENVWHMGMAAGSLDTAAQVARQQYERGIRMSLQGPLAEYAAVSAIESGMTQRPNSLPVYGTYRTIHKQNVIVESIPDGQIFAVPVHATVAKILHGDDSDLRGKPVVFAYDQRDIYTRHEPKEFAASCRIRAADFRESAGYQDIEGYRKLLKESEYLMAIANRIDPPQTAQKEVSSHSPARLQPARTRAEIVIGAVARMSQAFGYTDARQENQTKRESPSTSGVAFHLDGEGSVIWDSPRESVRLASAGYSILPVIHYGPGATPWICMEGERPTSLLVEHQGRAVVEFPVSAGAESAFGTSEADRAEALSQGMEEAMAYVHHAKAAEHLEVVPRRQRLEHAFHLGLLEQLGNSDVRGPEVDEARNNGLSATVLSIVRDANQNAFAIVEADASEIPATGSAKARHRLFAIPVADEDAEHLTVGEQASFLMLEWREHCTVLRSPEPEPKSDAPNIREMAEAGLGF